MEGGRQADALLADLTILSKLARGLALTRASVLALKLLRWYLLKFSRLITPSLLRIVATLLLKCCAR